MKDRSSNPQLTQSVIGASPVEPAPQGAVPIDRILTDLTRKREEEVDILLVHADSFYSLYYSLFNVGLLYIATVCREAGWKVKCLSTADLFTFTEASLRFYLQRIRPKLVGFYTLSDNLTNVQRYADWFKAWLPDCKVILGGPLANIDPEKLLEYPSFDVAVRGEGEYVMLDLAEHYLMGQGSLDAVEGITWKRNGRILSNGSPRTIRRLEDLPYPDHTLIGATHGFHISTGRGCPYKCTFCFQKVHEGFYRFRSAPDVVQEITDRLERYNVRSFYITDDVFVVNARRVAEIAGLLQEYRQRTGRDFVFFCEGRAEVIARHPEMVEQLVEAGMARLQIGIETGNQEMLDAYLKHLKVEHVRDVVRHCNEVGGLTVCGNFILGGPRETWETFEQTLDFAEELLTLAPGVFECVNSYLTPLPGTPIAQHPERFGVKVLDREFLEGMTLSDAYCETEALDRNEVRYLERLFQQRVDRTIRRLLPRLPFEVVENHFRWSRQYRLNTYYYLDYLSKQELLDLYFLYRSSPRFRRLEEIPAPEFPDWIPTRTVEKRHYSRDGKRLYLRGYFDRKPYLSRDHEKMIFELSASKLTAGQIAALVQQRTGTDKTIAEILDDWMIPLYRRLEQKYQIIFQK